jgi:Arc/MetJ-type ribon-helix-helix transcriptional regulator
LVQLSDELLASLDQHAASSGRSRSELIREAIERFIAEELEHGIDRSIVDGYRRTPQPSDRWVERMARESIAEEPW